MRSVKRTADDQGFCANPALIGGGGYGRRAIAVGRWSCHGGRWHPQGHGMKEIRQSIIIQYKHCEILFELTALVFVFSVPQLHGAHPGCLQKPSERGGGGRLLASEGGRRATNLRAHLHAERGGGCPRARRQRHAPSTLSIPPELSLCAPRPVGGASTSGGGFPTTRANARSAGVAGGRWESTLGGVGFGC